MVIKKIILAILIFVTIFGLVGCRICLNSKEIKSVTLICYDACLNMKEQPFHEKIYEDKNSIELFVKAIKNSKRWRTKGDLEFAGLFRMVIVYKDGRTDEYTLNVDRNSSKGLLLKSSKAYRISEKLTQQLKEIIYRSKN
jgi:hypothetical protein